ncbi:hypothetical protein [Pseudomonas sp. GW531-R1]|uniref:hypothetical protein n=1 Tax=Pseudomonas sp. GW531-R1 TaxID=2075556 RepID=UPI000CD1F21E|nr:hypothetical protein [Pseudomonas sp. GW531-R1]POA61146.1 hypothetical protein C1885_06030 [Pseudomonas sp. GW531-R1]
MALSKHDIAYLEPRLNELDDPIETSSDYARRVQELLPNFPEPVITQWFYDHHQCIGEHAWLDYPSLGFKLVKFGAEFLNLRCLRDHETVVQYRDYFLQGTDSARMNRLAAYIKEKGTWPVPPIIFDNVDGDFVSPWGLRYSKPYDLLEGHHRMAVLYALGKHKQGTHQIWLLHRSGMPVTLGRKRSK